MSVLLNRLIRDHRRFERIMTLLEGLLARFQGGTEPDYALMCELLEYVVDYADQVHHPSEALIFTQLRERLGAAAAPEATPLNAAITELLDQHQRLEGLNRDFRNALESIVHEAVLSRAEVIEQGQTLIEFMRQHIDEEEARVFPAAQTWLTQDDWTHLEQQAPSAADPVFGKLDPLRFRALYDALKNEVES